ncbi:MAG: alpha/beta fold hydrolase, partial [Roseiarcus sp.]|jgi:triacylglycerol lipase
MVGGGTLRPAAVAAAACAALLILNAVIVAAVYAILRLYAGESAPTGGAAGQRTWRCTVGEGLALFVAFIVIQPFERWWMGADAVGRLAPGRTPILLVHGYLCNRGLWWWLRRRLRARRFAVATINLEPPLAGLDGLAARLGERIDALLAETGAEKVVLVTHSMGGLAARAYLQQHGSAHVAGLMTLAAPHHGTKVARLGCGRNAREMRLDSEWIRRLNAGPSPPIPVASIWSLDDEIVTPPDTSRLAGARETILAGLGHLAMVFSPAVLARLVVELTQT